MVAVVLVMTGLKAGIQAGTSLQLEVDSTMVMLSEADKP